MARAGRPTKFTPEACEKILTAIKLGVPDTVAPTVAGVDYATFRGWINKRGRRYSEFSDAVKAAKGERVQRWLALIEQHATTNWTAAAWKLERMYPEEFGRVDRIDMRAQVSQRTEVAVTVAALKNEKARGLLAELEESLADQTGPVTAPVGPAGIPESAGGDNPGGNGEVGQ
jgi:hypothetical protein